MVLPKDDDPRNRRVVIPIRYPTPSREEIVVVVAQHKDESGRWMVPSITFEGPLIPHLESGRFARDLGVAFITASYVYDQMMLAVKKDHLGDLQKK